MAKSDGNVSNNKARSSKPYDASNSFVKKVASRVSGIIPQSTSWLSGWFSPSESNQSSNKERREQLPAEEDDFQDAFEQPPPAKRFRLTDNQQFSLEQFHHGTPIVQSGLGESRNRRLPNELTDMSSVPGTSGLETRSGGFAASTPAMTAMGHPETKTNGGECSESGESTSGCSSLEPQINRALPSAQGSSQVRHDTSQRKRLLDDKMNYSFLQNSRSLFLDRSMSSRHNQSVGRRNKPSFCVNTFGSPLFGDRGSLNDLIVNSPFYAGRTTFGGASSSSYRRSIGSASVSSSPANSDKLARHTIKVKSSHSTTTDTSMSQTARRILATLEQFSTPVLDAKRIPVSPREPAGDDSMLRKRARSDDNEEPRLVLEQARTPARSLNRTIHWAGGPPTTSKLMIPAVPDTLVLKRREKLQDSTTAARLMASSAAVTNMTCGLESYKLRTENETSKAKHSLKMKPPSKIRHERNSKELEPANEVNLPKIPLPIASLPSFDISVPPPQISTAKPSVSIVPPKVSASLSNPSFSVPVSSVSNTSSNSVLALPSASKPSCSAAPTFSFSSPIRVSPVLKDKALSPISNFSFSSPLPADTKPAEVVSNCVSVLSKVKDGGSFLSGLKSASKAGSVMDTLKKRAEDSSSSACKNSKESASLLEKFKPAAGSWECDKCMIRNKSELMRCAACTNPKNPTDTKPVAQPSKTPTNSPASKVIDSSFGAQFKLSFGMWECTACMVRNKSSDDKCVACSGPKPGSKPSQAPSPGNTVTAMSSWGDKFKPASNTWECNTCMVRNSSELTACQACTSKKPGSSTNPVSTDSVPVMLSNWGDKFKKPEGSWQCGDCLIDNKPSDLKCVACQAKKPGTESLPPSPTLMSGPKFSFGVPPASTTAATTASFTFGVPKESKEVEESKATVTSSTGFKFGETSSTPITTFSFGVPTSTPPSTEPSKAVVNPVSLPLPAAVESPVAVVVTSVTTLPVTTAPPAVATATSIVTPAPAPIPAPAVTSASSVPTTGTNSMLMPLTATSTQAPLKSSGFFGIPSTGSDDAKSGSKPADVFSAFKFGHTPSSVLSLPPTPQPSSSEEGPTQGSSAGFKRKLADETPSSTAVPFKFGAITQPDVVSPAALVRASTSSSSVSSTSGPVFCFSASSSGASGLETSSAAQPASAATNSPFSKILASPPATTVAKPASMFSLGTPTSKDESVTSTWKQAVNTSRTTDPKTTADGSVSSAGTKPIFAFGNVSSSGMSFVPGASTSAPAFSFGATSEKSICKPASASVFGGHVNSSASTFNTLSTPNSGATPSFGLSTAPGFGSAPSTNPQTMFTSAPAFGSSSSSTSTPAFGSGFGVNADVKKTSSPFSLSSDEKKPAFSFGASVEEKKPFTFQASTTTQSSTFQSQSRSVFTFGGSQTATNGPAKPEFSFGATSTGAFPTFNTSQPSTSSTGFNFGAQPPSSSVFGTASNPAPAAPLFRSTPSTTGSTMFSSTASSGPSFGSSSQPPGGFNFSFGSQNQMPPPAFSFEPNMKPSFNFTGGTSVNFAATPSEGPISSRRIRKAMRRTTPR